MKTIISSIKRAIDKYYFLIPSLLFCFLYYPSIHFGQAWGDDLFVINPSAKDFHIMLSTFYKVTGMVSDHYMPVHCLQCFLVNLIFGENAFPAGFHIYQFLAQFIVCILATILIFKITNSKLISVLVISFWTVHPVNQQQLTRLVVGPGIMGFAFSLIFILCYLYAKDISSSTHRYILMIVGNLFFLMGVMSVETFIFFPILLNLILFYLEGKKLFSTKGLSMVGSSILVYPIYFALRYFATSGGMIESVNLVTRWTEIGSWKDIVFRALWLSPQLIVHYLKLYFYPYGLVDSAAEWYMVGDSLLSSYSLFCQVLVCGLILAAILLYKKIPFFSLGMIWFFISLILIIQIIPIFSIVSLRYSYVPSLGLTFAVFGLISNIKKMATSKFIIVILMPIFCFLVMRTIYYLPSSKDFLNQFIYCVKEAPVWNKPLWIKLAIDQAKQQNELDKLQNFLTKKLYDSAINEWLSEFLDLKPGLSISYGPMQMQYNYLVYRLIFDYLVSEKRVDDLSRAFNSALVVKNNSIGWYEVASFLVKINKWDMAWEATKHAISSNPKFQLSYDPQFIAIALRTKKYNEAIPLVENYVKLNPGSSFPYLFAGLFYSEISMTDKALSYLKEGISNDKTICVTGEELYYQAARIFVENNMYGEAKQTLHIMLLLNPFSNKAKQRLLEINSLLDKV